MENYSIVIVDDEPDILQLVKYHLTKTGSWVEAFTSPLEAVGYIKSNPTSLVISDWMMPGMNGIDFCKTLKSYEQTSEIPIVMLTCKSSSADREKAKEVGVVDFIVKPTRMDELVRRVKVVLGEPVDEPKRNRRYLLG